MPRHRARKTIWTIGHSTRLLDEFAGLAKLHGIETLVDVRAFPGSRRCPWFGRESLGKSLPERGLAYEWLGEELGGRRRRSDGPSPNGALRNDSFRNYADYMLTPGFSAGVDRLLARASAAPTAFFCAELLWWRCHRSLIADYLTAARGWEVRHVLDGKASKPHAVKPEARLRGGRLLYPAAGSAAARSGRSTAASARAGRRARP